MHTWRQNNSNSRTQEHENHMLSNKTLRSHVTRDYTFLIHSGKANKIPRKCDPIITNFANVMVALTVWNVGSTVNLISAALCCTFSLI